MENSIFGGEAPKFIFDHNAAAREFTVIAATNLFYYDATAGQLTNNQRVKFSTTGTLPAPLEVGVDYYIINNSSGTCKVSETRGGTEVDITDTGTGTHSIETEQEVFLDYWITINEETDVRNILHESELEADRFIIPRGEYLEIEGRINLFKYEDMDSRKSKFSEIYEFKNKKVSLWKFRDGDPFKDENGNEVLFYIESVISKNLTTLDYRDVLFLKFRSLKGIDYPNSFPIIAPLEEIVMLNNY